MGMLEAELGMLIYVHFMDQTMYEYGVLLKIE